MTAEIAILNRSAIAMAADSAVTIGAPDSKGKERVWKTTNKLFSLSPENDIGVMIYGNGDFCGVPWETIVKLFSQKKNQRYGTVEKCKKEFVDFVKSFSIYDADIEQLNTYFLILNVVEEITNAAKAGKLKADAKKCAEDLIDKQEDWLSGFERLDETIDSAAFSASYSEIILDSFRKDVDFSPSKPLCDKVVKICQMFFERSYPSGFETGLVFGGFGSDEFLPCMSSVVIDGRSEFGVRWWDLASSIDMNRWKTATAFIVPFAQRDIAHLFIEGIEEVYLQFMNTTILGALQKKSEDMVKSYVPQADKVVESGLQERENAAALASIMSDFKELRRKSIVDPMLSVVKNLPKEEMAAMAESLVEITSLRRRMDSDVESVAGPVDVVVISKGDGLIWMKRKHYFEAEKNADFALRRQARRGDD